MGLDTSHNCWHGSYSSFSVFRNAVAVAGGYKLRDGRLGEEVDLDYPSFRPENFQGEWPVFPVADPLLILLVHSDCDGIIRPADGIALAKRMQEILPNVDEYWREAVEQFIAGLVCAFQHTEVVDFH